MRTVTTRAIGGRVNGDGTISGPPGPFTVRKFGVGDYALTFWDRLLSLTAATSQGNAVVANPYGFTGNGCNVRCVNTSGAAGDQSFAFTAVVVAT